MSFIKLVAVVLITICAFMIARGVKEIKKDVTEIRADVKKTAATAASIYWQNDNKEARHEQH